jgi:Ion channel
MKNRTTSVPSKKRPALKKPLPIERRTDRLVSAIANASTLKLAGSIVGSYFGSVVVFAVLYDLFELLQTNSKSLSNTLYFSLITQSTVGYGDVLPQLGIARMVVGVQVLTGILWAAFLPALLLLRITRPNPDSVRFDKHLVFDPERGQFVVRIVNRSRFSLTAVSVRWFLRCELPKVTGRELTHRTHPIWARRDVPAESRYPTIRPMIAYMFTSDRVEPEAESLPDSVVAVLLSPRHVGAKDRVIVEFSAATPYGTIDVSEHFDYDDIRCGVHASVNVTDDLQDWTKFDTFNLKWATSEYCARCPYGSVCKLKDRHNAEESLSTAASTKATVRK